MKYLAPIPKQFVDHNGIPLSDGKVHVYISGDTQYASVYQDADGEELMPNPVRLDSNGAWQGFVTAGIPMDYVVEDKDGNVQFEYEKVVAGSGTSNVAIEPVLTSGTKIAECWVDGELLELFAPDGGAGSSTIHHLAAGQYGYMIDMDNNGNIVTDQVLDSWMRNNEDVVLYDTYADASGYSNKPYMVQWYDASSTFTEGSTKIRFSRVGDADTPAKLTLYGFASNSEGYMKSASISGHASPWTVDVNVQADWNENDAANPSYIKNKPTIHTTDIKYTDSWAHVNAERDDSGGIPNHLDFLLIQAANCAGFKGVDVWCAFNMYWEADGTFPAGNNISVDLVRNGVSCGGHGVVYWPAEPGGYVEPNGRQNMLRVHLTGLSAIGTGDWYVRFKAVDEDSLPPRFINGSVTLINGFLFNE